jgi:hypothetical protein
MANGLSHRNSPFSTFPLSITYPPHAGSTIHFLFRQFLGSVSIFLAALCFATCLAAGPASPADKQNPSFKIPPVQIPLKIKDQTVIITASALLSFDRKEHDVNIFNLELTADLADLQQNLTSVLAAQLNKDDRCGERIVIKNATLIPAEPASIATVQLHFEQWVCAKLFGKEQVKKLVAGDATIPLKLTPVIDKDNTELRLLPELGEIQADGSLGQLLKSGILADSVRDKMHDAIQSALQKGANLGATLPPAAQTYATIQSASFKDAGRGRLVAVLDGQVRVTNDQLQQLAKEVKGRIGKH